MFRKKNTKVELTSDELNEVDEVISDEDVQDDYLNDDIPDRHISISSIVLTVILLILIVLVGIAGYCGYKEYRGTFPSEWCSCRVNDAYLNKIKILGSKDKSFIVSPMGLDLSLVDLYEDKDFEQTQKLSVIVGSNRGYQSLTKSDQKLLELASEEEYKIIKNIGQETSSEIADYLGSDYELNKAFIDSDVVNIVKLPTELKADVFSFDGEAYITGNYFKSGEAFKVEYKDNIHELILYKNKLPDEDSWKSTKGTLVVPETSAVYTTSSTQTVKSLFGNTSDDVKLTQIIKFELYGEKEPDTLEYTNKVGSPFNLVVRNKNTGLIIVGGTIRGD